MNRRVYERTRDLILSDKLDLKVKFQLSCPPGSYCPEKRPDGSSGNEVPITCPLGSYCPDFRLEDGSKIGSIRPIRCGPGFKGNPNGNGIDEDSSCLGCPAGTKSMANRNKV